MNFKKLISAAAVNLLAVFAFAQDLNVTFQGHLAYPGQTLANICGYVDSLGNEYALVGASQGLSIVDVTNPTTPVQVIQIPGPDNLWKEIKVRGKYAYVTTEGGGGLQIVNLSSLPNTAGITYHNYTGDAGIAGTLNSIHALHIDGHYVYLYGSNLFDGGAVVLDIIDPWNPHYVGNYMQGSSSSDHYVHDGYVRNDTLYAGHIYTGRCSVVDFTNKTAPVELANFTTPNAFTHNTWLSQDSKTLFTTDEVNNSFLTSYDISNLSSIQELDRIQSNPGSNSIVHNVHILNVAGNDYAVTSWYKDGFTIVDAGRPQNLVQVGNYDTYTIGSGGGFEGAWGVYPFLPSGTIVVSNIHEGLYVLSPTYVRACYLEGVVTDSITGLPINGAHVEILTTAASKYSNLSGDYKTGIPSPGGVYSVRYSKPGYNTKVLTGISLAAAVVTLQDVELSPINTFALNGQVTEQGTGTPIANANVQISNASFNFSTTTNASGNFNFPAIYADDYDITVGHWGHVTYCASNQSINASTSPITIQLPKGWYDDFSFDFGWTVSGNATDGLWLRDIPVATFNGPQMSNPGMDDSTDCLNMAYVTGNNTGSTSSDDVDNGSAILKSPLFDLTTYTDPYMDYTRWFYNAGGAGAPNDSLKIMLNNGTSTVILETVLASTPGSSTWVHKSHKISSFITPTATMLVFVRTADVTPGHLVEAGFDKFLINEGPTGVTEITTNDILLQAYPNPFADEIKINYNLNSKISDVVVSITDVTGKAVYSEKLNSDKGTLTLNPELKSGLYFVNITNGKELMKVIKVVKVK